MKNKVYEYIKKHNLIERGDHIILGLSGGPDSVCLFFILKELRDDIGFHLHPLHLNHGFRGEEADRDQVFCRNLGDTYGIKVKEVEVDCPALANIKNISHEEAGRLARYQAFAELGEGIVFKGIEKKKVKFAVAHHRGDQVETVLMRIIRGTGIEGLGAMRPLTVHSTGFSIIRPMLDIPKEDIMDYLNREKIEYCTDKTNEKNMYLRNKIRLDLIPYLEKEFNPNIKESLIKLSKIAGETSEYLDKEIRNSYKDVAKEGMKEDVDSVILNITSLRGKESVIKKGIIIYGLNRIGLDQDLSYSHVEGILNLLESKSPSAQGHLPKGFQAQREYDALKLYRIEEGKKIPKIKLKTVTGREYNKLNNRNRIFIDGKKFFETFSSMETIKCRTRIAGDFIYIGEGKRKKIKDLFIDDKIPRYMRDEKPLVVVGNYVIWIPEKNSDLPKGRVSHQFALKEEEIINLEKVICIEICW